MRALSLLVLLSAFTAEAQAPQCATPSATDGGTPKDALSYTRILRRISLSLTGTTPTAAQYQSMVNASSDADREQLLSSAIDDALASPRFYDRMFNFGQEWLAIGAYTTGAVGDAYQGDMAGHIWGCPAGSIHAGAYYGSVGNPHAANVCNDKDFAGNAAVQPVVTVEPWWAPGTTVTVVGAAGSNVTQVPGPNNTMLDCGFAVGGYYDPELPDGCGCGPNLVWCAPLVGLNSKSNHDLINAQRRHPYEEPARLFAHLAWHDRPLSDLVTGNYSVGTNWLRHLYVRQGHQQGSSALDANTTWWKPAADTSPRDPRHADPNDPQAWREFVVEDLNPYLLSLTPGHTPSGDMSRTYHFDPRTTTAAPDGLPSAGVLTMIGSLSAFPRERVRSARFLETFACQNFQPPPADVTFPPYAGDPATSGTCLHCHRTLDPGAIFFKRWTFGPQASYIGWPNQIGVGSMRMTPAWLSGNYPYCPTCGGPAYRFKTAFLPGTVLTPITAQDITNNPEAVLLDTMPATYTLLGQHGDGTMGPLGFGKIVVQSGEFDRCVVRKLYSHFIGRELDPAAEKLYLDKLAGQFVQGGRKVRPFLRVLFTQSELRRGL